MKHFLILVCTLLCSLCYAQQDSLSYKIISEGDFNFPVFSGKDSLAVQKINQLLQLSELELLKGHEKKSIFEAVAYNNTDMMGRTDIKEDINVNNGKLLSLEFEEATSGGTMYYYSKYYNFNSQNGDIIRLSDLFTPTGYKVFRRLVIRRRMAEFNEKLSKMDSNLRSDLNDIAECYRSDSLEDFSIGDVGLGIYGNNCFSKGGEQKFDEILPDCVFRLAEFRNYLNDYGKCVFSLNKDSIGKYHSGSLPQLYYGTIGKQKICLLLNSSNVDIIDATYTYLKYGIAIKLRGGLNNGQLKLSDDEDDPTESIEAKFSGNAITGTWYNKGKTKSLKVLLKRK